ncbi:MAG: TetR/AcrR family transcriptional regulator [Xanthomonadales bacterium]|nr:TetR/AcrR family transcriptional regulator [Xanthomonadales bacterium]
MAATPQSKAIDGAAPAVGLKGEISDFKRRRIREEACHLFFRNGYEGATIDAIAQRLDVTKPFIYSYYKNKSVLLFEICQLGISRSLKAMDQAILEEKPPMETLKSLLERVLRIIMDYQEYIVVYVREEKNLDPALARQIREMRNLFDHRLAELLEKGNASGEFAVSDPVMTATTVGGMMTWVSLWYSPRGKWTEHEVVSHVMWTIESVVRGHPDSRAGASMKEGMS